MSTQYTNQSGITIHVNSNNSQTIILGDWNIQNSSVVDINYSMSENYTVKDIPFLYVDGKISGGDTKKYFGASEINKSNSPYNVYCGSMELTQPYIHGDLYLMDENATSTVGVSDKGGSLYNWADDTFNKTSPAVKGGSIYCKGNLNLGKMTVYGDVRVEGDCTINSLNSTDVTIGGKLVVGGNLVVNGNFDGIAESDVYVGGTCSWSGHEANINQGSLRATVQAVTNEYQTLFTNDQYYIYTPSGGIGLFGETGCWNNMYYKYDAEYDENWTDAEKLAHVDSSAYYWQSDVMLDWGAGTYKPYSGGYWIDGRDGVTVLEHQEDGDTTYYENGVRLDPQSSAFEVDLPEGMTSIYPANMTREAIYGYVDASGVFKAADSTTKIVMTLEEVQKNLNYDLSSGGFNTNVYPKTCTAVMDVNINSSNYTTELASMGNNQYKITKNTKFDGGTYGGTSFYIDPSDGDIWIEIAGNVTMNNGSNFIVKQGTGNDVYFFIDGSCTLGFYGSGDVGGGKPGIEADSYISGTPSYAYNAKSSNITIYGGDSSTLHLDNNTIIMGSVKAPYTTIDSACSTGPKTINYTDEFGQTYEMKPAFIGNVLCKGVKGTNNFTIAYTDAGAGGASSVGGQTLYSATGDRYELSYYAAS